MFCLSSLHVCQSRIKDHKGAEKYRTGGPTGELRALDLWVAGGLEQKTVLNCARLCPLFKDLSVIFGAIVIINFLIEVF